MDSSELLGYRLTHALHSINEGILYDNTSNHPIIKKNSFVYTREVQATCFSPKSEQIIIKSITVSLVVKEFMKSATLVISRASA